MPRASKHTSRKRANPNHRQPTEHIRQTRSMTLTRSTTLNFNHLPIELRLQIWQLTIEPRQVVVWQASRYSDDFYFRYTAFPVALHICRESRNELLRQHTPLTLPSHHHRTGHQRSYPSNGRKHYVNYVNFAIDTVVIPGDYNLSVVFRDVFPESHLIQSIAIGVDMYGRFSRDTMHHLQQLPSLNSLYVIIAAIREEKFELYDPSTRYKLYVDEAPPGYSWKSHISSYRELIAKDWVQEPVPFKGLLASGYGKFDPTNKDVFFCDLYRHWMRV